MPKIEVSHSDLCNLIGTVLSIEELKERAILFAKGEIEEIKGDKLKIDIKDTNRPDLWSAEGIAREIKGRYLLSGLPEYKVKKSNIIVKVDKKLKDIRPLTVCAVVKGIDITDEVLSQMIQLQEKVSMTFGRNRKEVAIGVYDLHKITPPIRFTTVSPTGIKFAPLDFREKMTPEDILKIHPKGKEYGHLLDGLKEYPIFIDSKNEVLSMPPIINSDHTGKVTENTRDIFIECSGFEMRFLEPALNVIVSALADRGGQIESVTISLPNKTIITPNLKPKKASVELDMINKLSGLNLSTKQVCKLLEQARYKAMSFGKKIKVLYPAYRQDIMHPVDIVEDVIISYGYENIKPEELKIATIGRSDTLEAFSNKICQLMIGAGMQEILSYILSNKKDLFEKMELKEEPVAEIKNIVSANWSVFRHWLIPGLLEFLSNNKHVEYPQKIFEIGDCVVLDSNQPTKTRNVRKLAAAISNSIVNYEEIASVVCTIINNIGIKFTLKSSYHPSFIKGRCADIVVEKEAIGFVGEISPQVLNNWRLEKPVVAFEVDLEKMNKITQTA